MGIPVNAVFQADCLALLERIESEQVTLAYIDPPLNTFSPFFTDNEDDDSQREYVSFMSKVLQQIRRVLCNSGSVFLYLNPRSTAYVRLILDQVFGRDSLRTEIVVPLPRVHPRIRPMLEHDTIIVYSKSDSFIYNPQFRPLADDEVKVRYKLRDERGPFKVMDLTSSASRSSLQYQWRGTVPPRGRSWRYSLETLNQLDSEGRIYHPSTGGPPRLKMYLDESPGVEIGSIWDDISAISPRDRESPTYPTQKRLALLERIVRMGSNPGDLVLDPFSGTGTTLVAAQMNDRTWLGCDSSAEAYSISLKRIERECGLRRGTDFAVGDQDSLEGRFPIVAQSPARLVMPWDYSTPAAETPVTVPRFVLGQRVTREENRHWEFKEIKGTNPIDSIKNVADEYVVAFLNSGEGGRILWGVRDTDGEFVGVSLNRQQRDRLKRVLIDKLSTIQPSIDPTAYRINLHEILDDRGRAVPDLYMVEIVVPRVVSRDPYYTGGNEVFVKTDAGKKKLSGPEQTDFIKRRLSSSEWEAAE
jgi:DNA modification methylase